MHKPETIFGSRLRELRLSRGLSQAGLAEQIHTTVTTISRYEQSTREPNFETLRKLTELFSVDFNYLLGGSAAPPQGEEHQILIRKFSALDDRGKAAVLNALDHEYTFVTEK